MMATACTEGPRGWEKKGEPQEGSQPRCPSQAEHGQTAPRRGRGEREGRASSTKRRERGGGASPMKRRTIVATDILNVGKRGMPSCSTASPHSEARGPRSEAQLGQGQNEHGQGRFIGAGSPHMLHRGRSLCHRTRLGRPVQMQP